MLVNGGRVEYVTDAGKKSLYWNIPIANTTSLLLGTGTSITQAAMRELAKAGVLVGFCGGGGTPLFSANEVDVEIAWMTPQSEYRPTEYLQSWVRFWFDDALRLNAAKRIQASRLHRLGTTWQSRALRDAGFSSDADQLAKLIRQFETHIESAPDVTLVFIEDHCDMSITIGVAGKQPSALYSALLTQGFLSLKPLTVHVNYAFTSIDGAAVFGFDVDNEYVAGFDRGAWAATTLTPQNLLDYTFALDVSTLA